MEEGDKEEMKIKLILISLALLIMLMLPTMAIENHSIEEQEVQPNIVMGLGRTYVIGSGQLGLADLLPFGSILIAYSPNNQIDLEWWNIKTPEDKNTITATCVILFFYKGILNYPSDTTFFFEGTTFSGMVWLRSK